MKTFDEQGYHYYPSKYSPPLGHTQLDIYISSIPSDRLFNVCEAIFPTVEPDGINELSIIHPWEEWMGSETQKVCAGRFKMLENNRKTHNGFSLGGELKIQKEEMFTLCTLSSSAPIFNLTGEDADSAEELLVNEIEVLFAERKAAWERDESGFAKRLLEVEPFTLFAATLISLDEEIEGIPNKVQEHGYQTLLHFIENAIHTFKVSGEWPEEVPALADLI